MTPKIIFSKAGIITDQQCRIILLSAIGCFLIQFIIFKTLYPYPNFVADSSGYISAAHWNAEPFNIRPIGYSKFLWLFSLVSHSDLLLVAIQFFFLQFCSLYFLFTVLFFFKLSAFSKWLLVLFCLLNPVYFYVANYILSDALFIALSFAWFALLIRIVFRPQGYQIFIHAILLFCLFTIRYNAACYILVSILAIILSHQEVWKKLTGVAVNITLVMVFVFYTIGKEYNETGIRQFSPFGGWQLANNALWMYQHVTPSREENMPDKFIVLHAMVRKFVDTALIVKYFNTGYSLNSYYMWNTPGPLKKYALYDWKKGYGYNFHESFHMESGFYKEYGTTLIRRYPVQFMEYYLWPNFLNYISPPTEFLSDYNHGTDSVSQDVKDWFHYKSSTISSYSQDHTINTLNWYPYFGAAVNCCAIIMTLGLLFYKKGAIKITFQRDVLWIMALFWILNMVFSVCTAPIVLRYQVFPINICFLFCILAAQMEHRSG
jgi:hypothetical protein